MAKREKHKIPERPKRELKGLKRFEVDFGNGPVGAIMHDLPDVFGLSIECALPNYTFRTAKPTLQGFCDYMLSKQPHCVAYPEKKDEKKG